MLVSNNAVMVRRVYDEPLDMDGTRVLVDRIWPRGLSKEMAHLDEWCKQVAPSTALRKWYAHVPERFDEFAKRYRQQLKEPEQAAGLLHLHELTEKSPLTLLTATKHPESVRRPFSPSSFKAERSRGSCGTDPESGSSARGGWRARTLDSDPTCVACHQLRHTSSGMPGSSGEMQLAYDWVWRSR